MNSKFQSNNGVKERCIHEDIEGDENNRVDRASNVVNHHVDCKELLGKTIHNEEEAYQLYANYAHQLGFSIRRDKQYYFPGTRKIRRKDCYCSKSGFKDDSTCEPSFKRLDTRTGCKAMISFEINQDGMWKVSHLFEEHNHHLAPEERYFLRSSRMVSRAKGNVLSFMVNAGISTINEYSYMVEESRDAENLGFIKKDCYNYVNAQKMMLIEVGDSQSLVNYFKRKGIEEGGMFCWDVQLDQDGRMANFYWRDGRLRTDYDCFGDMVVFDTTYRTNRYNLICTPFIGVNHH